MGPGSRGDGTHPRDPRGLSDSILTFINFSQPRENQVGAGARGDGTHPRDPR